MGERGRGQRQGAPGGLPEVHLVRRHHREHDPDPNVGDDGPEGGHAEHLDGLDPVRSRKLSGCCLLLCAYVFYVLTGVPKRTSGEKWYALALLDK